MDEYAAEMQIAQDLDKAGNLMYSEQDKSEFPEMAQRLSECQLSTCSYNKQRPQVQIHSAKHLKKSK